MNRQQSEELNRLYDKWSDEALVQALTEDRAQYQKEVLPVMEEVLRARSVPVPPAPPSLPADVSVPRNRRLLLPRPAMGAAIGAGVGALAGLAIPVVMTYRFLKQGGDPIASGGLSFLAIGTVPIGAVTGAAIGALLCAVLRRSGSDNMPGDTRR